MADILTKHVDNETLDRHCRYLDAERRTDRHVMNPKVAQDAPDNKIQDKLLWASHFFSLTKYSLSF